MCRLKHFLPPDILLTIYNTLVLPHLNYSLILWGFGDTSRVLKLQKRAIRTITASKYNAHTSGIFKSLCILTIDDLFLRSQLKFYFQFKNSLLPKFHSTFTFPRGEDNHLHNTRNKSDLNKVISKDYMYTMKRIRISLISLLNELSNTNSNSKFYDGQFITSNIKPRVKPKDIISLIIDKIFTHSLPGFTKYIKIRFLELYNDGPCKKAKCYPCGRR